MYYIIFIKHTEYKQNTYQFNKPYDSKIKTENYTKHLHKLNYNTHVKTNIS